MIYTKRPQKHITSTDNRYKVLTVRLLSFIDNKITSFTKLFDSLTFKVSDNPIQ